MDYKVQTAVKPRKTPSMYETIVKTVLPIDTNFSSTTLVTLLPNPPITGQVGPITWIQMSDGYWVPMVYKTVTYVVEIFAPPVTGTPFSFTVLGYKPYNGILTPEA